MKSSQSVLEARMLLTLSDPLLVRSASPAIETLLGFSPDDFLSGRVSLTSRIHTHDQDIADALFSGTIHQPSGTFNLRLRQANGRIRCVKVQYEKYLEQHPSEVRLDLWLQDSKSLQQAQDALPLMDSLKAVLENTDDYIYFKDRNHVFTGASQTMVAITDPVEHGSDLYGQTDYDVFAEEYADDYYRLEKQVFAGLPVASEVQTTLTKDGKRGWVDNRKYPIRNENGEITGLFGIARDITKMKRVEQTLAASELRFQTIFEHIPAISVQGYDCHRRVIFWNQASEQLYGFTREQALGRRLEELIIPEPMRETVVQLVTQWAQGGPAIPSSDLTLQNADGKPVQVFSSHVMLRDPNGEVEMYCIDIDITEHKRIEKALLESEQFLRTMIDEIPDPVVVKDGEGNFLLCNQTVARLYNTTPEAMVGKHDGDFGVPGELAEFFRANVLGIMARGETEIVYEDSRDALTGDIRHYKSIKKPFKNIEGKNQILVIAQDMTDIVKAQAQVAENERRLQEVMEITQEGVWDWHVPTGRVLHNPQWYKTLGIAASEASDTVEAFAARIHSEDKEMVWKRLDAMLKGETDTYSSEHRLLDDKGRVLWVQDRGRLVERDEKGAPLRVVGSFSDITFRKEYEHKLEHFAHYDALTGLPNRVLMAARMRQAMAQAQRYGSKLMVAYIDLDGFKAINDSYGHKVGDQLLMAVGEQMKLSLRESDLIARLGGDEFVAILTDIMDMQASEKCLQTLLAAAAQPMHIDGLELKVSGSMGITCFPQHDEVDADQLLRQADQAMYQAKLAGKNRYHFFDAEQDRTMRGHNESIERIRQALADGEFVLYYQPKVNMRTGEIMGAEALIRWQHPDKGLLLPMMFLPVIEDHPLAIAIGEWVIDTALTQIERWRSAGLALPVSVNTGARQLQQANFVDRLRAILATHQNVNPADLTLEILETSALEDLAHVSHVIEACRALGVPFALDDFGTGYSSLSYLRRLPLDQLKIDRSFVNDVLTDPNDAVIAKTIIALGQSLGLDVIAEGVETEGQRDFLAQAGCLHYQGYLYSKPLEAQDFEKFLNK